MEESENYKFQNYTCQFLAYIQNVFLAEFFQTKDYESFSRSPTNFQGHTKQPQKNAAEWYFTQVYYIFAF